MSTQPSIVVSSLDLDRLALLLDNVDRKQYPAASQLERELDRADVLEPADMPADVITMNSRARFVDETSRQEHEMTLVYPKDADGSADKVSILAPVGSALLGLSVGQTIDWPTPGGGHTHYIRVLAICFQPEAAGEMHR